MWSLCCRYFWEAESGGDTQNPVKVREVSDTSAMSPGRNWYGEWCAGFGGALKPTDWQNKRRIKTDRSKNPNNLAAAFAFDISGLQQTHLRNKNYCRSLRSYAAWDLYVKKNPTLTATEPQMNWCCCRKEYPITPDRDVTDSSSLPKPIWEVRNHCWREISLREEKFVHESLRAKHKTVSLTAANECSVPQRKMDATTITLPAEEAFLHIHCSR